MTVLHAVLFVLCLHSIFRTCHRLRQGPIKCYCFFLYLTDCMIPCTSWEGKIWYYGMFFIFHWFNPLADLFPYCKQPMADRLGGKYPFVENKALLQQEGKYLRLHKATPNTECVCMSHSSVVTIPALKLLSPWKDQQGFKHCHSRHVMDTRGGGGKMKGRYKVPPGLEPPVHLNIGLSAVFHSIL